MIIILYIYFYIFLKYFLEYLLNFFLFCELYYILFYNCTLKREKNYILNISYSIKNLFYRRIFHYIFLNFKKEKKSI